MQTVNDAIAFGLEGSKGLLKRLVEDLSPGEMLHRPTPKANCAAWLVGHLVLTERRVLGTLEVPASELPALPEGFEQRFSREEGVPQADEFGDTSGLLGLFEQHRDVMTRRVRSVPAELLNKPLQHPRFKTVGEAAAFMGLHVALHAGQISTIRRSLGRPPIV